jgi:hypothetical protein
MVTLDWYISIKLLLAPEPIFRNNQATGSCKLRSPKFFRKTFNAKNSKKYVIKDSSTLLNMQLDPLFRSVEIIIKVFTCVFFF